MDKLSSNKLTAKACTQKMVVGRQLFPIAAAVRLGSVGFIGFESIVV